MPRNRLTVLDQIAASDKVRKKIIDAASALYASKGFGATSIQEISETANVALPVTYHYVKKKSEIMRLIMEDVLNIFRESLIQEIRDIGDPVEKLTTAVILYLRVLDRQHEKILLLYQKSSSLNRNSKTRIMALEVEVSEIFSNIINEGIAQGVFKAVDVDLMAYNILMLSQMWILKHWHFKNRLTLDKYIDHQLATIMDALGTEY
ncbi:MAG: TetR family transcriptional regulator [Deltaproteobacteria bacterium]|nr:TetR family transcriptional regulator [Deltaproteobacteria bacterium]